MQREPETLWGPLLQVLTRRALCNAPHAPFGNALLAGLAVHPAVHPLLRVVALAMIQAGERPPHEFKATFAMQGDVGDAARVAVQLN